MDDAAPLSSWEHEGHSGLILTMVPARSWSHDSDDDGDDLDDDNDGGGGIDVLAAVPLTST